MERLPRRPRGATDRAAVRPTRTVRSCSTDTRWAGSSRRATSCPTARDRCPTCSCSRRPPSTTAIPGWQRSLVSGLNRLVPKMAMANGGLGDKLSRDPAIREAYVADPLNLQRSTVRLGHEGFVEQARVNAAVDAIDAMPMPTYVFHGSDGPRRAGGRVGGDRREGQRDPPRPRRAAPRDATTRSSTSEVMAEVVAWLEAQRPPLGADRASPGPPRRSRCRLGAQSKTASGERATR